MAHVVGYDEFDVVVRRLDNLERENDFLRKVLSAIVWLSKAQTAAILGVSETTVWRLMRDRRLTYRQDGGRVFFQIDSIRQYMLENRVNSVQVESRVFPANREPENLCGRSKL